MSLQEYLDRLNKIKKDWQDGDKLTLREYHEAIMRLGLEYKSPSLCPSCGAFGDSEHLSTCTADLGM